MGKDEQIRIAELEGQIGRFISDIESEKATRKRRNEGFDTDNKELRKEINDLKEWKSNIQGRMAIAAIVWAFVQAIIIWLITKK